MAKRLNVIGFWLALGISCYAVLWLLNGSLIQAAYTAYAQSDPSSEIEPVTPDAILPGLEYAYYELDASLDSQTPVKTGTVANFDLSLNDRPTDYAFRFTGYLQIMASGYHTFTLESADTVRLALGGQTVVTHSGSQQEGGNPAGSTGSVDLQEGFYTFLVEYSHADTPANSQLALSWSTATQAMEQIPSTAYFRDDPDAVPTATATLTPTATPTMSQGGSTTFLPTSTPTVVSTPSDQLPGVDTLPIRLYVPSFTHPASTSPSIFFVNLKNGSSVQSPFDIEMDARNFEIEEAGSVREGAGHFHLMIDTPCISPGQPIPNDASHRHYGSGARGVTVDLPDGEHTLCLQAGDGQHTALDLSEQITIFVTSTSQESLVTFSQPANGTVLNGRVEAKMVAENFIIEPAGSLVPGRGHFHIMINTPCIVPGNEIPRNETHLHFGQGQTDAELDLEPGNYTLCLQAGTGIHNALDLTEQVTITVQAGDSVYLHELLNQ